MPLLRGERRSERDGSNEEGHTTPQRHARKIGVALCLALTACHHDPAGNAPTPLAAPGTSTTADRVWVLERNGPVVHDTTVTFSTATGRSVILRHEQESDVVFLMLDFPAVHDTLHRTTDSTHVTIHPVTGHYAFSIAFTEKPGVLPHATFAYAMHFRTPDSAAAAWPSPARFEQRLMPVFIGADSKVTVVAGDRPAGDMLRFAIKSPGTYALVAPK